MIKGVIRLGDSLSRGGRVTCASGATFDGMSVMLAGDSADCAIHGETRADTGHPSWTMNGRQVVVEGCQAQCGCTFTSSLPEAGVR